MRGELCTNVKNQKKEQTIMFVLTTCWTMWPNRKKSGRGAIAKILKRKDISHFETVQKFMVVCLRKCCRRPREKTVSVYIVYVAARYRGRPLEPANSWRLRRRAALNQQVAVDKLAADYDYMTCSRRILICIFNQCRLPFRLIPPHSTYRRAEIRQHISGTPKC